MKLPMWLYTDFKGGRLTIVFMSESPTVDQVRASGCPDNSHMIRL